VTLVRGAAAVILVSMPVLAAGAQPAPRHRVFWDASLGPVYTDNVYRDSSAESDLGHEVRLRLGLRSRHSPRTFSQLHYDLDLLAFPDADVENRTDHAFGALLRHRLGDSLTLETKAGLRFAKYPQVPVFDSVTWFGQAALKHYLTTRTTLEGGFGYEKRSYADFDLDYGGAGLFATLSHDMGRRTFAELSAALRNDDYSERVLREPAPAGDTAAALRTDRDWLVGARVVRDLSLVLKLDASYQYGRLTSNGDSLDFGPFQSQLTDFPGDERLIGDFYSHRRHELSARLRRLIRRGSSVTLAARYQDRAYRDRPAKNAEDEFLTPPELRHDRGLLVTVILDVPIPVLARRASFGHFGLRLRLAREVNHSNEALYDYDSNLAALSVTSWF
jgi:hypothetical protein